MITDISLRGSGINRPRERARERGGERERGGRERERERERERDDIPGCGGCSVITG